MYPRYRRDWKSGTAHSVDAIQILSWSVGEELIVRQNDGGLGKEVAIYRVPFLLVSPQCNSETNLAARQCPLPDTSRTLF